jgi:glycosidase
VTLSATGSTGSPYTGAPLAGFAWRLRGGSLLGDEATLVLPEAQLASAENYVEVTVTDADGKTDSATTVILAREGRAEAAPPGWRPAWIETAVLYGVVPWLFGSPPLEAVTEALDRLAALGVGALWLSPIFDAPSGDYGYAVTNHFAVRPSLGDVGALRALVAASHERGIRVILDMPLNDTSSQHPYYLQALDYRQQSRYWGFYERTASGAPEHYFNWKDLPNLEYAEPEVQRLAIEAALFWLREADVDGFRLDAAWGVQQRTPGFWSAWTAEVLRVKPDALLLAEASAREALWSELGFTLAYDWTANVGEWAWTGLFSKKSVRTSELAAALATADGTPPLHFIEDNDTGKRFISSYGIGATRAAAALLAALPGMPLLFTGQEIGAEYEPYKQTAPLDWDTDPHELQPYYTGLLAARREAATLTAGAPQVLGTAPASVIAVAVEGRLTAVNFAGAPVGATIQAPGGAVQLALAPWGAASVAL